MTNFSRASHFFRRHPLLRDACLWAVPALIFGAVLRLLLLDYSPYAYWGSDSRSYYLFAHHFRDDFGISLAHKRRFLYPILLLPVSALPGSLLQWVAWLQAGFGLAAVLPLAYAARKSFGCWRVLIIPMTLLFAGLPVMVWYEHELLAEAFFFAVIVWAIGGWAAWAGEKNPERARRLWWWFFAPFAAAALTKPSALFFCPGLAVGFVMLKGWQTLRWKAWTAAAALAVLMMNMGSGGQSAWLLYTAAFPLTRLDTPLHAPFKAEIRDMVEKARDRFENGLGEDGEAFKFLRNPKRQEERPLWKALAADEDREAEVHKELALEAIRAHPLEFFWVGLQRAIRSANLSSFKEQRFKATYFADRFEEAHAEWRGSDRRMFREVFGIPARAPMPSLEAFRRLLAPKPDSKAALWLRDYAAWYGQKGDLFIHPQERPERITDFRPTLLAWWLVLGAAGSLCGGLRRTLGVWTIVVAGYLAGVYLVGVQHVRYFAPVWPVLILLLGVPLEILWRVVCRPRMLKKEAKAVERVTPLSR